MNKEDFYLFIRDLYARERYGVKVALLGSGEYTLTCVINSSIGYYVDLEGAPTDFLVDEIKPYLRPMEDMTDEEKYELAMIAGKHTANKDGVYLGPCSLATSVHYTLMDRVIAYLDAHMLDHRGLIYKRIAQKAPEGMYTRFNADIYTNLMAEYRGAEWVLQNLSDIKWKKDEREDGTYYISEYASHEKEDEEETDGTPEDKR